MNKSEEREHKVIIHGPTVAAYQVTDELGRFEFYPFKSCIGKPKILNKETGEAIITAYNWAWYYKFPSLESRKAGLKEDPYNRSKRLSDLILVEPVSAPIISSPVVTVTETPPVVIDMNKQEVPVKASKKYFNTKTTRNWARVVGEIKKARPELTDYADGILATLPSLKEKIEVKKQLVG